MEIVYLDGAQLNPGDLDWSGLESLGNFTCFDASEENEVIERCKNAEIVITNKVPFDRERMEQLPKLKCICVSATGYNIIDTEFAKEKGIVVCNCPSYSTDSVAQHVFASILAIYNRVENYSQEVRSGKWTASNDWSYTNESLTNLEGKTLGILGFGGIGQRVGEIGQVFGMKVISHHKHPHRDSQAGVGFVDLENLFKNADVLSLHVPLNETTKNIVNADTLSWMKSGAVLINTGRGPLVDESALAMALKKGIIRAAALDVLSSEPPEADNPLFECENCFITPHIAWAGINARNKLMKILENNIQAYFKGIPINVVN